MNNLKSYLVFYPNQYWNLLGIEICYQVSLVSFNCYKVLNNLIHCSSSWSYHHSQQHLIHVEKTLSPFSTFSRFQLDLTRNHYPYPISNCYHSVHQKQQYFLANSVSLRFYIWRDSIYIAFRRNRRKVKVLCCRKPQNLAISLSVLWFVAGIARFLFSGRGCICEAFRPVSSFSRIYCSKASFPWDIFWISAQKFSIFREVSCFAVSFGLAPLGMRLVPFSGTCLRRKAAGFGLLAADFAV